MWSLVSPGRSRPTHSPQLGPQVHCRFVPGQLDVCLQVDRVTQGYWGRNGTLLTRAVHIFLYRPPFRPVQ